jgi:hypothetical protein
LPAASSFRRLASRTKEALDIIERWDRMNEKTDSLGSVVVLEEGAGYPSWIAEYQRRAPNCVVIAHNDGESMEELTARVVRRLPELNGELRVGIVACAASVEPSHLAMREQLCRTLLSALNPKGGGEVVLAASLAGSDGSKHAIFELAGALCDDLRGSNRVVRVRFSNGRCESGIMPSLASTDADVDQTEVRLALRGLAALRARQSG